ncbi:hypothetical protein GUJ93_ZPchr0011g27235 [Zizania palustris]|nr:hypothetical protein GUJ93_ZPchr0011g27235 [Zizania palustris]
MSPQEECLIIHLHARWGNRWSRIARRLPGRTDNEIKNYWRTHMRKKAQERKTDMSPSSSSSSLTYQSCLLADTLPPIITVDDSSCIARGFKSSSQSEMDGYPMEQIWREIDDSSVSSSSSFACPVLTTSTTWDYSCPEVFCKMANPATRM